MTVEESVCIIVYHSDGFSVYLYNYLLSKVTLPHRLGV